MVIVLTRSRAGLFPIHAAFPDFAPGRRPHCSFRGLLKLYTHYGPPDCSPTIRGLCREVSISTVTSTHRSPAIESNHQLFEWVLPPLVFSPKRGTRGTACATASNQQFAALVGRAFSRHSACQDFCHGLLSLERKPPSPTRLPAASRWLYFLRPWGVHCSWPGMQKRNSGSAEEARL